MTRMWRAAAVIALTAGGVVVGATAAAAHAILLATTPADGSVLRTPPSQVSLRFDEAVGRPAYLSVTGPGGRVDAGSTTINGAVVSVKLRATTSAGSYTVAYRVVSDDGHPVEGTFRYQLGGAAVSSPSASTSTGTPSSGGQPSASAAPSPASAAAAAAAARTRADAGDQGTGSHWFAALAGVAVVLAGAGALVWERLHRADADQKGPP
jgi:copper resistance protein C